MTKDSSITITDESDADENGDQPRVNLVLSVVAANTSETSSIAEDAPPLRLTGTFEIKRKPPKPIEPTAVAQSTKEGKAEKDAMAKVNGHVADGEAVELVEDGLGSSDAVAGGKRKRGNDDANLEAEMARKRGRVMEERPFGQGANGAGVGAHGGEVEMGDAPNGQGGIASDRADSGTDGEAMRGAKGMKKGKGARGPEGAEAAFVVEDDGGAIVIDD